MISPNLPAFLMSKSFPIILLIPSKNFPFMSFMFLLSKFR